MTESKKICWLKLPKDFFEDRAIKKLKAMDGGDKCIIIYLKMLLKSLDDDGKFYYEGIEKNIIEEIALDLDEREEDVQATVNYLVEKGLLVCTENEVELTRMNELIGRETDKAKMMRKLRNQKNSNNVTECYQALPNVTECYLEKEKEKEIDKELEKKDITEKKPHTSKENDNEKPKKKKYGTYSHVLLTENEYQKLTQEYPNIEEIVQFLDNYIEEKGYTAKSHYLSIKRWVASAVAERAEKGKTKSYGRTQALPNYMHEMNQTSAESASEEELQDVADLIASLGNTL